MSVLEKYEWSDLWCENANEGGERILLMGDSITRGYYDFVKERLADKYNADKFSTSAAVDNPAIYLQLDCFLKQFEYAVIHCSNGLHGEHIGVEDYAADMKRLINYIKKAAPHTKLILAKLTPVMREGTLDIPADFNEAVLKRNEVIEKLAKKYGLPVDDLYSAAENKPEIRLDDGYHYKPEGYKLLSEAVTKIIIQNI